MQKNWIGKSIGAEIEFRLEKINKKIKIFTTRPDTIYGASFIAISINHKIVLDLIDQSEVQKIKDQFSVIEYEKEKIGIPLRVNCINPISEESIPLYIANFVLDNYGEGAIFGCPAHDERDFEFAKKYKLPIKKVVQCSDDQLPYTGDGIIINSPLLNGLYKDQAITKIIENLDIKKIGKKSINYKLRDWGFPDKGTGGAPFLLFTMRMARTEF